MSQTFPFTLPILKPLQFNYSQCPVCGARLKDGYRDYVCEGTLCENEERCPNGCWYYHFAYGNIEMAITFRGHSFIFYSSYHDIPQECYDRDAAMNIVTAAAQTCLLEDCWKIAPELACYQCGKKPATAHFCGDDCARKGFASPLVQSEVVNESNQPS